VNSKTHGSLAPLRRFLAIFLGAWAIVFAYLGATHNGTVMVIFILAAVVCAAGAFYFLRSFAFAQRREF